MASIFARIETEVLDFLKGSGKAVEEVLFSAGQALVASAKATPLGTLAVDLIQVFDSHDLTGQQKFDAVLGALTPVAPVLLAAAGVPAPIGAALDGLLRELVQSSHNDLKTAVAQAAVSEVAAKVAPVSEGAVGPANDLASAPVIGAGGMVTHFVHDAIEAIGG